MDIFTCRARLSGFALAALLIAAVLPVTELNAADETKKPVVSRLIEQLGSRQYVIRHRAERELMRMGFDVFDALKAAESNPDLEIASRARYLSQRIKIQWVREGDSLEVRDLLRSYAKLSTAQRRALITKLGNLGADAGMVALCRVVRFESSQLLSKVAAIALLEPKELETKEDESRLWKARSVKMKQSLASSRRASAQWLHAQLLSVDDREGALAKWSELIEREQGTLATSPAATEAKIVIKLMRRKVALLKDLGRRDQAVAVMIEMIDLEDGNPDTLVELVRWLTEEKAWEVIDQVAKRFANEFQQNALLLYSLAEVREVQGKADEADKIAQQAAALSPGDPSSHLQVAFELQQRGLLKWAESEYRLVIKIGPPAARTGIFASLRLSELLHDFERELEAGKVLEDVSKAMEKDASVTQSLKALGRDPEAIRSRMEFFFSSHYKKQKDRVKQRAALDRAIAQDPTDADVLIAMHRMPEADEAYRTRVSNLIKTAATQFKQKINQKPDDATELNQYAWLVGNTEGDVDEAIRFSHRSLQIRPDTAGYLDTLAHCYYRKGDYASAVKYQQQAVNIDPHQKVIARMLDVFKEALAKSKAADGQN